MHTFLVPLQRDYTNVRGMECLTGYVPTSTDEVLAILRNHSGELRERGITRLQLFGSFARDQANDLSEVDLLTDLDPRVGPNRYRRYTSRLEEM